MEPAGRVGISVLLPVIAPQRAVFGRLDKNGTPEPAAGQWLCEEARELAHTAGRDATLEVLGMAGKADPAPTAALSEALGPKGAGSSPYRGASQLDFLFPFLWARASRAEGPGTEDFLLIPSLPTAASDTSEAVAVECEEEPGRASEEEGQAAVEVLRFLPDPGRTELVAAAGNESGFGTQTGVTSAPTQSQSVYSAPLVELPNV
ncbi:uncharacterized protein LOC117285697 isoform X2 [Fukomys damarensis]|uniref:uncharacterized protein LOC117285697 isoform X2 n=1 Tax=Fukomys damarensis TaxID=885580 RepID=UPI0014558092|nr:uncharacterized protein LOC117285697 isoform X2 [Fukomys damarensis]